MSDLTVCPHCGRRDRQIKAGMNGANQRLKCAHCLKRYTATTSKRGYPPEARQKVREMRAAGESIDAIIKSCGVSRRTIYQWLSADFNAAVVAADGRDSAIKETASTSGIVQRASIKQVATHAGVSVSTVSNFLNRTGRMTPATEQRVRAAIEALHFAPNSLTRAIRQRRTRIIGLITYGISAIDELNSTATGILAGVNDACQAGDYGFLVYTNFWQPEKHYAGLSFLDRQVDGLIWVAPEMREPLLDRVGAAGLPAVALLSRHVSSGVGYVNANNIGGIARVVEHLIQLGHHRLAFFGPSHSSNYLDRRTGFWNAVTDAGLTDICCEFCPQTDIWCIQSYEDALERWCSSPNRPTALVTSDDGFAIIAITWLEAHGYRVPLDFSVTGVNDATNAASEWPGGLTTLRQPFREIAKTAASSLIDRIEGRAQEPICTLTLETELVIRGSTGIAPSAYS